MDKQPKRLIAYAVECAALFALSAYLVRLGACWLAGVWPILLAIAGGVAAIAVGWRLWRSRQKW